MAVNPRLLKLISAHYGTRYLKVLDCAPDVWRDLQDVALEKSQEEQHFMPVPAVDLFAIEVHVQMHYRPGQWKMVRHDNCEVIGGEDPEQAMIVTHERCTLIDEERGE